MKRIEWILIVLIVFTWLAEDLYHLAPRKTIIFPFPFTDEGLSFRWYVFEICNYVRFGIFVLLCLIIAKRSEVHLIVKDTLLITIIMIIFSLFWFLVMYNNPFYKGEWWIKIIVTILIYFSIYSIRNAKRNTRINNSFFGRGPIHRID